jgi:hypothetical protein
MTKWQSLQWLTVMLQDGSGLAYTVVVDIQMDRHLQQATDQQRTITCQLPADSLLLTSQALRLAQEPLHPSARLVPRFEHHLKSWKYQFCMVFIHQ